MRFFSRIPLYWIVFLGSFPTLAYAEIAIGGRVVGPDQKARRGVEVVLEVLPPNFERLTLRAEGRVAPEPRWTTTTDAEGYFKLAAPEIGMWKVAVRAAGFATMEHLLRPLHEAVDLPTLTLVRTVPFEVRVRDSGGHPQNALVGLYLARRPQDGWRARLVMERTGDRGAVRLARAPETEQRLEVLAPGHPLLTIPLTEERIRRGSLDVTLTPGMAGTVRVKDPSGRPVEGAVAYQGTGVVPLGRTDAEGRLELVLASAEKELAAVSFLTADEHGGKFDLRFEKPEEEDSANEREGSPESEGQSVVEVTLDPPLWLRGRVVEDESRDPIADALVWTHWGQFGRTDGRGSYELAMAKVSWVYLYGVARGYSLSAEQRRYRDIEEEGEGGPTLVLRRAALVGGLVVDQEGEALAGVEVRALPIVSPARDGQLQGRSSRLGRFRLTGIPVDTSYKLLFRKEGYAPHRRSLEGLEAFEERTDLRVVLEKGRVALGRVIDEDEVPVAGAEARLIPVLEDVSHDRVRAYLGDRDRTPEATSVMTDAEGRFRMGDLAAGRYELEIEAAGYAPTGVPGLEVPGALAEVDLGTVVLIRGVSLDGLVRDPTGTALAGAEIYLRRADPDLRGWRGPADPDAVSDAAGRFTVAGLLPDQQIELQVRRDGFGSEVRNIVPDPEAEPLEIVLRPAARLSGRVLGPEGDPIEGANVRTYGSAYIRHRPTFTQTDAQGFFALDDVEPGKVTLRVDAQPYQRYEVTGLEIPAGGERSGLEIVLKRGATVSGTLRDADGKPVAKVRIFLTRSMEGHIGFRGLRSYSMTDNEGRFRLEGAEKGPSVLVAQDQQRRHVSKAIEVKEGEQRVDLVFEPDFEVSGRVFDASGAPIGGAFVSLEFIGSNERFFFAKAKPVTTGGNGSFTLKDVGEGRYRLRVAKAGYSDARMGEAFEVRGGPVTGLEIEMQKGIILRGRLIGLELDELAQVQVSASGGVGGSRKGRVDYEGEYEIHDLGPGFWHVEAELPGGQRRAFDRLEVKESDSQVRLDLEFRSGYTLSGVVLSAEDPVRGARVMAFDNGGGTSTNHAFTGSDGRFLFRDLPAGSYRIHVALRDALPYYEDVTIEGDREMRIEIAAARISGHVFDRNREGVAGVRLQLERLEGPATVGLIPAGSISAETDSRGFFSVRASEGRWRLSAVHAGYAPARTVVDVGAGLGVEGVELTLEPAAGITFEVAHGSGAAVTRIQAAIFAPDGRRLLGGRYEVSDDGVFRMSMVPAGAWELAVQSGESAVVRVPVSAPGDLGPVILPQGGTVYLTLSALAEDPGEARVFLTDAQGRRHDPGQSLADSGRQEVRLNRGRGAVTHLLPGTWTYKVVHSDGRTWTGEVLVAPGGRTNVVVP